jgi:hypothetical protein
VVKINHPHVKNASAWLGKHPYIAVFLVVLAFVVKDMPQGLASVWALRSSKPLLLSLTEKLQAYQFPQALLDYNHARVGDVKCHSLLANHR